MNLNLTCKKCPLIKGDTYCSFTKKSCWKFDEMCGQGYLSRIDKGINLCSEKYNKNPDDFDIKTIMDIVWELEKIWIEKFSHEEVVLNVRYEQVQGPELPF